MLAVLPLASRLVLPVSEPLPGLELGEVRSSTPPGAVLRAFAAAVTAGLEAGQLVDEDRPLIEGARVLAEALDTARRLGGMKGGYLAVQALPPYQRALHALRLPVELTAVPQPAPGAGIPAGDTPDWVRDAFGTAE